MEGVCTLFNFRLSGPLFFSIFFVLQIKKKSSRRSLTKKRIPDSDFPPIWLLEGVSQESALLHQTILTLAPTLKLLS